MTAITIKDEEGNPIRKENRREMNPKKRKEREKKEVERERMDRDAKMKLGELEIIN